MYHHGSDGSSGKSLGSFTPSKRQKYDLEPPMLCWTLYTSMNHGFTEFLGKHTSTLKKIDEIDLVWHQFKIPERSLRINGGILNADFGIDLEDFPCLLFIDSFTKTQEVYRFKINESAQDVITQDLSFALDQVRKYWRRPALPTDATLEEKIDLLVNARRNCILSLAPSVRFRKVKNYVSKGGISLVKMALDLGKPFIK
jgi:hypothetical protein